MNLLLDDRYAPITSKLGFIKCPVKKVLEEYLSWDTPIQSSRMPPVSLSVRHGHGDLPEMLNLLLPLTNIERRRMLFIQTVGDWTAFFDNGWQGTDVFSTVSYLCRKLACQGVRADYIPHSLDGQYERKKGRYGATIFELYGFSQTHFLNIKRAVSAAYDGNKWKFSTTGVQQPFEDSNAYKAKAIKDRFTPEMLDSYLKALGIKAFDIEFYNSPEGYYLVEKVGPSALGMESFSLNDARAHYQ
jgi:hypothetical protein